MRDVRHTHVVISLGVILLALTTPLRDVLALALWLSFATTIVFVAGINRIIRAPQRISPSHARRNGLATLSFTSHSAWSAVQTRHLWEESAPPSKIDQSPISSRLDEIFRLIKASFILPWYDRISPSPAFPNAVETLIRRAINSVVTARADQVDWSSLIVSRILPIITEHIHHYQTVEHLSSTSSAPTPNASLPLPLPPSPHPALRQEFHISSKAPLVQIEAHFRDTLDRIMEDILPDDSDALVVQTMVREVLLGTIILPVFEMTSDADFWNRQIIDKGGKYLHEQNQVNRFLSALSTIPQPTSASASRQNSPLRPKALPFSATITAMSSTRDVEAFLKSIQKVKTLGEARRLRVDIERAQRQAQTDMERDADIEDGTKMMESDMKRARKFVKRMERARLEIDAKIRSMSGSAAKASLSVATSQPTVANGKPGSDAHIDLHAVLADPSTLAYWLEYMDRRGRSRFVQFWLTVEGFKDPLDVLALQAGVDTNPPSPVTALPPAQTVREDLILLIEMYFLNADFDLGLVGHHAQTIQHLAQQEHLSALDAQRARRAMFACQQAVYEQMEDEDWAGFKSSELYVKASSDLVKAGGFKPRFTVMRPDLSATTELAPSPQMQPLPTRGNTGAPIMSRRQTESVLLSPGPLSPKVKAIPSLIGGYFSPKAVTPLASVSITTPFFSRTQSHIVGDPALGTDVGAGMDLSASTESLSPTPGGFARRSTQLDTLMDLAEGKNAEREKLFNDEDEEELVEDEDEYIQVERMEAIQAALNDIIAGDDLKNSRMLERETTPGDEPSRSPSSSVILVRKPGSTDPLGKMVSRSVEDLRSPPHRPSASAPHSRVPSFKPSIPHRSSSSELKSKAKVLFDDSSLLEEHQGIEDQDEDDIHRHLIPAAIELGAEIARLQDRIQDLVKQEHLLENLIRQAELTGDSTKLLILRRSHTSIRREQRTAIWQKAQFEQQDEESRLVPGQTIVTIPTAVITKEDGEGGKQVVKYTINVEQNVEKGAKWVVARRYNEFWELDRSLREWAPSVGMPKLFKGIDELPPKKLVPDISASFIERRRKGLEKYLHSLTSSVTICESRLFRNFLSRSSVSRDQANLAGQSSLASLAPHNIVKSLYKTMATSLDENVLGPNMLDMMYTTLSRQLADIGGIMGMGTEEIAGLGSSFLPPALRAGWANDQATSSTHGPRIDPMGGENAGGSFTTPICDLFSELFDLNESNWLRRRAIVLILEQVLGGTIERRVRDTVRTATSADSVEKGLAAFQEILWPGGVRRPPSAPRTDEEKMETRHQASQKLGLLMPDVAANIVGRGNACRAARRVFGVLQDQRLNQLLMLCILDEILGALFPTLQPVRKRVIDPDKRRA